MFAKIWSIAVSLKRRVFPSREDTEREFEKYWGFPPDPMNPQSEKKVQNELAALPDQMALLMARAPENIIDQFEQKAALMRYFAQKCGYQV